LQISSKKFIDSDEEDAELVAALKARTEQDEDKDDDSTAVVPWALSQARAASDGMKTFFHENQAEHAELRKYMAAVEGIEKLLEKMTFFGRGTVPTFILSNNSNAFFKHASSKMK